MNIISNTGVLKNSNTGIQIINNLGNISGGGGGGDMYKSVYDIDNNNIVDNTDAIITEILAAEDIHQYSLVTSDGYVADSSNVLHRDKIVGIALESFNNGFVGKVQVYGELYEPSWTWTLGAVFLNSTSLSQTPPTTGFVQVIGRSKTSEIMLVKLEESILL